MVWHTSIRLENFKGVIAVVSRLMIVWILYKLHWGTHSPAYTHRRALKYGAFGGLGLGFCGGRRNEGTWGRAHRLAGPVSEVS